MHHKQYRTVRKMDPKEVDFSSREYSVLNAEIFCVPLVEIARDEAHANLVVFWYARLC